MPHHADRVRRQALDQDAPEVVDDPERPRAVNAALQSEYARRAGICPTMLTAAIDSYLPIVRVLVLLGGAFPAHRERLIQRVDAALYSEGLIRSAGGA